MGLLVLVGQIGRLLHPPRSRCCLLHHLRYHFRPRPHYRQTHSRQARHLRPLPRRPLQLPDRAEGLVVLYCLSMRPL